jgi:hypothetical protein
MKRLLTPRGIRNVSKLTSTASRAFLETQTLALISNASFRYHIPRRIQACETSRRSPLQAIPPTEPLHWSTNARYWGLEPWLHTRRPRRHHQSRYMSTSTTIGLRSAKSWLSEQRVLLAMPLASSAVHKRWFNAGEIERHASARQKSTAEAAPRSSKTPSEPATPQEVPESEQEHHFYDRLHIPQFHRPTKEELMAAATGFWSRMRVRLKWSTIRSIRPYNMDSGW